MALKKAKEIKKNFRAVVQLKKEKELDDSIFSNLCLVISTVCMHKSYNPHETCTVSFVVLNLVGTGS